MISLDLKPSQAFCWCWILVQNSKIVDKGQQLQEVLVVLDSDVCRSTFWKLVRSLEYISLFLFKRGQIIQ